VPIQVSWADVNGRDRRTLAKKIRFGRSFDRELNFGYDMPIFLQKRAPIITPEGLLTVIDPESMLELGDEPSESLDGQLRPQPVERHLVPHPVLRAEFVD